MFQRGRYSLAYLGHHPDRAVFLLSASMCAHISIGSSDRALRDPQLLGPEIKLPGAFLMPQWPVQLAKSAGFHFKHDACHRRGNRELRTIDTPPEATAECFIGLLRSRLYLWVSGGFSGPVRAERAQLAGCCLWRNRPRRLETPQKSTREGRSSSPIVFSERGPANP
jgi:hypothetical protein